MATVKKSIWGWIWSILTLLAFLSSASAYIASAYHSKFTAEYSDGTSSTVKAFTYVIKDLWVRILFGALGVNGFVIGALLITMMVKPEFLVEKALIKLSPFLVYGVIAAVLAWPVSQSNNYFIVASVFTFIVFALFWKVEAFRPYRSVKEQDSLHP